VRQSASWLSRSRTLAIVSLFAIVPGGVYTKFYQGPAADWVNNSLGGAFYEIFWCLLVFLILPNARTWVIALAVVLVTCMLEFMQLWEPAALTYVRGYFLGAALLGTTFSWSDFPYYFVGSAIGWFWLSSLQNKVSRLISPSEES
jgi:hypothetical protein